MAYHSGRAVLVQVETGTPGTYATVGGNTSASLSINNEIVDVTSKDDAGVRKLLAGVGIRSMSVSVSGNFADDANFQFVRDTAEGNLHRNFKIAFPGDTNDRTYTGSFAVTSLEQAGDDGDKMTYTFTLESAGTITAANPT